MIDRVVLDIQLVQPEPLTETGGADERGESRIKSGARLTGNGKQFAISPEVLRPPLDFFARDRHGAVVVSRLERTEALLTDPQRFGRKLGFTQVTLQTG